MNRWIRRVVTVSAVAGALAFLPSAVALANEGEGKTGEHGHKGHHGRGGLMSAALKLDSLTGEQRTAVEKLEASRKAAEVPVHQANVRVLTDLAKQVEQDHIDRAGLKAGLDVETGAAEAARTVDVQTLTQLHTLLTPAQRAALVDGIAARIPEGKPRPAALESFKGDSFDASAMVKVRVPGERAIATAEKKVPSMSPAQRAEFASHLREHAARGPKV